MDIYHYHPATGELMGHGIAEPDPLVGGEFLVPAHATVSPPPAAVAGKARCWRNGVWQQVEDNRGVIYSIADGYPHDWDELGPVPEGYTVTRPEPPQLTTGELSSRLRSERDARISAVLWMRERHADELELGKETTLTPEQYTALLTYIQALRDMPQQLDFPHDINWPQKPELLSGDDVLMQPK